MTPRERILAILDRRPVDRIPVDIWTTPEVAEALRRHTGAATDAEAHAKLGLDKVYWSMPAYQGKGMVNDAATDGSQRTMWGARTRTVRSGAATYSETVENPWAGFTSTREIEAYPLFPDPAAFGYDDALAAARETTARGYAVMGPWISHFEIYCGLRGLENALADVIEEPALVEAGLDRIGAIQTALLERFLPAAGPNLDWVFISDDLGMQESLLMSLEAIDRHILPRLRAWCDLIHRHGKKVMFHTDGAVLPLIPRLLDAGIDILNPIQHACPGMDCAHLKKEFSDRVIFYGGVENQKVLPFGTPADVRAEVRNLLQTLGRGGGFICCSCHNIQAGTPVDNVLALIDTVLEEGHKWLGA